MHYCPGVHDIVNSECLLALGPFTFGCANYKLSCILSLSRDTIDINIKQRERNHKPQSRYTARELLLCSADGALGPQAMFLSYILAPKSLTTNQIMLLR